MNRSQSAKQFLTLLLVLLLGLAPLARQARASTDRPFNQNEDDLDGVSFDNLLATSSYSLYIEVRNIGQHARSGGFSELVEPLLPIVNRLPKEVDALARFIVTNADVLSRSRLMIATEPAKPSLPPLLIALELASADAAQGFEGKIQDLMASLFAPMIIGKSGSGKNIGPGVSDQQTGTPSPFVIKRAGRVLAFSSTPFTFKGLKAEGENPLSDDPNFRAAHDRFYSEALFLYYDIALATRVTRERIDALEKDTESGYSTRTKTQPPTEPDSPETPPAESSTLAPQAETGAQAEDKRVAGAKTGAPSKSAASVVKVAATAKAAPAPSKQARAATSPKRRAGERGVESFAPPPPAMPQEARPGNSDPLGYFLSRVIMTGGMMEESAPEAAALALTLESDSLILRGLMITPQGAPVGPIPFLSNLQSGPAQASNAANYLPADTDVFVTASLDLTRLYDTALGIFGARETPPYERAKKSKASDFESKVAAFEKANGFRIRDEIESTLGNEVAIGLPARYLSGATMGPVSLNSQTSESGLVFLLSVRNKESLRPKLRPVLEAIGLKSPNEKGLTEKYGDIEISSYSQASLAFINNYLVIGGNAATVRRVIDARAKNETLATSRDFHDYMQWQPRETLAQVYVSGAVLKGLFKDPKVQDARLNQEGKQFLARFSFEPEPITYVAASEGSGALYELRIPKNLLMRVFAEIAVDELRDRVPRNEMVVRSMLNSLGEMEKLYKAEHARYGTLEELEEFLFAKDYMEKSGYKFDLVVSGNRYEATATPVEYGKSGRLSFFTDQSGVVREGDHGGKPATAADKQVDSNRDK